MSNLIEEAIREHWGERCPDFEPGCPCCRAWAEFDNVERLRAALELFACDCIESGNLCPSPQNCRNYIARAALEGRT